MGKRHSKDYLSLKGSALLILSYLDIDPYIDNNLDKMYRRIQKMIRRNQIPFGIYEIDFVHTADIYGTNNSTAHYYYSKRWLV
jgi:hypothetical protein